MAKVVYYSYHEIDVMMQSLGMEARVIDRPQDIQAQLLQCKRQHVGLVYISEAIYHDAPEIIDAMMADDFTIIVFDSDSAGHHGRQRMKDLLESAIGIKTP